MGGVFGLLNKVLNHMQLFSQQQLQHGQASSMKAG
jgi:hypothetical protein